MMCMPLFFFGGEQMQKVMFYDKAGLLAEQIKNMEFWTMHRIYAAGYCPDGRRTGAFLCG